MKLVSTRQEYVFEDESGYRFKVVATKADEDESREGWRAEVSMRTAGFRTAEDAISHLRHAAEAFLRQLKESEIVNADR